MNSSKQSIEGYVVGAYAASPTAAVWDPDVEAVYYTSLAADERIGAFEVPWTGNLHAQDEEWFFAHFPQRLGAVFTDVARVFITVARGDERYGLASTDRDGRARALADAAALRDDVRRFHDRLGRRAVLAVELHSAPRPVHAESAELATSLRELASWDWEGAELTIEHCDAFVPDHAPEKGFLRLTDEIAAITASQADVGIVLNWGRSAIEFHDAARVVEHVFEVRASGLLKGYVFSGASDQNGTYDRPWVDAHNAFAKSEQHPFGDPISLLTDKLAKAAISAVGSDAWLGEKFTLPGSVSGGVAERVAMIRHGLDTLDRARER